MCEGGVIILCAFHKISGEGHHLSKVGLQGATYDGKFRVSVQLLFARWRSNSVTERQGMNLVWGAESLVDEKPEPLRSLHESLSNNQRSAGPRPRI